MKQLNFSKISSIDVAKKDSYNALFLTIDLDWAAEDVINDTIDLIEEANIEATWFITHNTKRFK